MSKRDKFGAKMLPNFKCAKSKDDSDGVGDAVVMVVVWVMVWMICMNGSVGAGLVV